MRVGGCDAGQNGGRAICWGERNTADNGVQNAVHWLELELPAASCLVVVDDVILRALWRAEVFVSCATAVPINVIDGID